jgi:phage baseplate assembly protein W
MEQGKMKYQVSLLTEVDFAPDSEVAEILQNVRTILSTRLGTVPLHRDLGLSWGFLDKPLPIAKMEFMQAAIEALEEYEPRVRLLKVEFDQTETDAMEGKLNPRVIVSIGDEDETEE